MAGPLRGARVRVGVGRVSGRVLAWKGCFGWIVPETPIDHSEAWKHGGRVYVNQNDISCVVTRGAIVSFLVYADGDGLGAEQVKLEGGKAAGFAGFAKGFPKKGKAGGKGSTTWLADGQLGVQRPIVKVDAQPIKIDGAENGASPPSPPSKGIPKAKAKLKPKAKAKTKTCGAGKGCSGEKGKSPATSPLLGTLRLRPCREKATLSGGGAILQWASSEMQGWRPAMEDATCALMEMGPPLRSYAMFGVFDGHGGGEVSRKVAVELPPLLVTAAAGLGQVDDDDSAAIAEQALSLALPAMDTQLREDGEGGTSSSPTWGFRSNVENTYALMGSTAVVALVLCEGVPGYGRPRRVVVANCGDSRAALCRGGVAVPLSEDQKPEMPVEKKRIEAAGGSVAKVGPCFRVDGWGLNLSRALGDFHYKSRDDLPPEEQKVSAFPELCSCELTDEDEFLLLGCDGVFELHSWQDAVDIVREGLEAKRPLTQVVEDLVDKSCSSSLMQTQGQGGDNVSAMVVLLR